MGIRAFASVPALESGARVALVAPAGPLRGEDDLERAVENVRGLGWEPVVGAHVLARAGYLAGSDADRLSDLNEALRDPAVDGVWCLRGGYGVMRILEHIDYAALRKRPKAIIGYSDISALHAAVGQSCGIVSYHGPTARESLRPFSRNSFERAVRYREDPCGAAHSARTIRGGVVRGRLVGGNLALLAALVGSRYAPDCRRGILVLEDVNEPLYRIDRMLRQLLMSGTLANVAGLAIGQFTEGEVAGLDGLLHEIATLLNIPCVVGLPIGHIPEQWTIPLGAFATFDADGLTLTVGESA